MKCKKILNTVLTFFSFAFFFLWIYFRIILSRLILSNKFVAKSVFKVERLWNIFRHCMAPWVRRVLFSFNKKSFYFCSICLLFGLVFLLSPIKKNISLISNLYADSHETLPDCRGLPVGKQADPGANCLIKGLPLCSEVPSAQHGINCNDVIDLPLCSLIEEVKVGDVVVVAAADARKHLRNCVNLCSEPSLEFIAKFNKNCTRYCDNMPDGVDPDPGVNCNDVLMDCRALSGSVQANPGVNCSIKSLPLCKVTPSSQRRVNCNDVIDLPVCTLIASPDDRSNLRNCVNLCSDSSFNDDNPAVFNENCTRYCDNMPDGVDANPGVNCDTRQCHDYSVSDLTSACSEIRQSDCSKLWPIEHGKWRKYYSSQDPPDGRLDGPAYCKMRSNKCFNLDYDLLQYVNLQQVNAICLNHHCPPVSGDFASGDLQIIYQKRTAKYQFLYNKFVSPIFEVGTANPFVEPASDDVKSTFSGLSTTTVIQTGYPGGCYTPMPDKDPAAIIKQQLPCTNSEGGYDGERVIPDVNCDSEGNGAKCNWTTSGYCYRTVDCGLTPLDPVCPVDAAEEEAVAPPTTPGSPDDTMSDDYSSYFHRPAPSEKATYLRDLCGSGGDSEGLYSFSEHAKCKEGSASKVKARRVDPNISGGKLCTPKDWRSVREGPDGISNRGRYGSWSWGALGTMHFFYYDLFESSISPGVCMQGHPDYSAGPGNRGIGYIYLKGTDGLLYNKTDDDVIYHEGGVETTFDEDGNETHTVRLCLRFRNTICVQCEGRRECVPTAGSTLAKGLWTQACGRDYCKTFAIKRTKDHSDAREVKGHQCMYDSEALSLSSSSNACSEVLDGGFLRMRAVYHETANQGYVCGYLDVKGQLGYDNYGDREKVLRFPYGAYDGSERIDPDDPTSSCQNVSEKKEGDDDACNGFNSAIHKRGYAHVWRTVKKAIYVENNQEPNYRSSSRKGANVLEGYYDVDNNFHYKMFCAPVRKRIGSVFYNVATTVNSPTILHPPIYIHSVVSSDFFRPEVRVHFGTSPIVDFADGEAVVDSCYAKDSPDVVSGCRKNSRLSSYNSRLSSYKIHELSGHNQVYLSLAHNEISGRESFQAKRDTEISATFAGGREDKAPSYVTIQSEIPTVGERIKAEIYIKKEYNSFLGKPTFCVYERTKDADGNYSDNPNKIGCRDRSGPYGTMAIRGEKFDEIRVSIISGHREPEWRKSGEQVIFDGDIIQKESPEQVPEPPSIDIGVGAGPYCGTLEAYSYCLKRDECTELSFECSNAIIGRSNAAVGTEEFIAKDAIVNRCENTLLPSCLEKRGLNPKGSDIDILYSDKFGAFRCRDEDSEYLGGILDDPNDDNDDYDIEMCVDDENPFRYGWHNVVEISAGFDGWLDKVVAHRSADKMGICKIHPNSYNLIDVVDDAAGDPVPDLSTHCLGGGNGRSCKCISANELGDLPSDKFYIRRKTGKEAGLHLRLGFEPRCDKLVATSTKGEAFSSTVVGSRYKGRCDKSLGWVESKDAYLNPVSPSMKCEAVADNEFVGAWNESSLENPCVRRSCNIIRAGDANAQGNYLGYYDESEDGECKGARHGFANWLPFTPNVDRVAGPSVAAFTAKAQSCIVGFKPLGSTAVGFSPNITEYKNGVLPKRICSTTGIYGGLTEESVNLADNGCDTRVVHDPDGLDPARTRPVRTGGCERITCPIINHATPTSISDPVWKKWFASGGAIFTAVNASRSSREILNDAISFGTCNADLGFVVAAGGVAPLYGCDYLGNTGPIQNPCITLSCDAISEADANNLNNGYAKWDEVTDTDMKAILTDGNDNTNTTIETANSCKAGYVQNPYPPAYDLVGNRLLDADVLKGRSAEMPKRYCLGGLDDSANVVKIWRIATNPCINKCPGGKANTGSTASQIRSTIAGLENKLSSGVITDDELRNLNTFKSTLALLDDREGVGVTRHNTRTSGSVEVHWPSADLGQEAYMSNWSGTEGSLNASKFQQGRSNDIYLLKRTCGSDGKWSEAVPMCAANKGVIKGASFNVSGIAPSYQNSVTAYTKSQFEARSSDPNFEIISGQCSLNHILDASERNRLLGIIGGLDNSEPNVYCRIPVTNNIDKVYYAKIDDSSTYCNSCSPLSGNMGVGGYSYKPVTINSADRRFYPGERVDGSADNDNGSIICNKDLFMTLISNSPTTLPYFECNANGSGRWLAGNMSSCKRSCEIKGSEFLIDKDVGRCGGRGVNYAIDSADLPFSDSKLKIRHGEIFEFNAYSSCKLTIPFVGKVPVCYAWRYSFRCDDGAPPVFINNEVRSFGGCDYSTYDYRTSQWTTPVFMPVSVNTNMVVYRHIQRGPSYSSGKGMSDYLNSFKNISVTCSNCSTAIRHRGVADGSVIPVGSMWDEIDSDSALYKDIGTTRVYNCGTYIYSGSRDLAAFNTSAKSSWGPGEEITGACGSNSILRGASPKISCHSDGTWSLINENNCKNKFNSGNSEGSRFIYQTAAGFCPDGTQKKIYFPENVEIPDGSFGVNILYQCKNMKRVSVALDITVEDGEMRARALGFPAGADNKYSSIAEYDPNRGGWSSAAQGGFIWGPSHVAEIKEVNAPSSVPILLDEFYFSDTDSINNAYGVHVNKKTFVYPSGYDIFVDQMEIYVSPPIIFEGRQYFLAPAGLRP